MCIRDSCRTFGASFRVFERFCARKPPRKIFDFWPIFMGPNQQKFYSFTISSKFLVRIYLKSLGIWVWVSFWAENGNFRKWREGPIFGQKTRKSAVREIFGASFRVFERFYAPKPARKIFDFWPIFVGPNPQKFFSFTISSKFGGRIYLKS